MRGLLLKVDLWDILLAAYPALSLIFRCLFFKMSIVNLETLSNDDLKKHVLSLIDIDDWSDECGACGRPSLLHKGVCTRMEKEPPDVILKVWKEYQARIKVIVKMAKAELRKEQEDSLFWMD